MGLFTNQENRVRCGKCNTEFDLDKNAEGCPLCGFGKNVHKTTSSDTKTNVKIQEQKVSEYLQIPTSMNLEHGKVIVDKETKIWGSWLMFNDFFAPKFLVRILAWKMKNENSDSVLLNSLLTDAIEIIHKNNFSSLKGFPNLEKDEEGGRLVHHFLRTFNKMGLVYVEPTDKGIKDVWKEKWDKIRISLTKEGLEFAQIKNNIFDMGKTEQILTEEEKEWLIDYYKKISKEGYNEYYVLKEVYDFIKKGKNGNRDLWEWFEKNKSFQDYIKSRSKKAESDPKIFKKQLGNYAKTFASAKISLLRELGIIKNKRNDYTILGEL